VDLRLRLADKYGAGSIDAGRGSVYRCGGVTVGDPEVRPTAGAGTHLSQRCQHGAGYNVSTVGEY
jgi:hypothetical protein